MIPKNKCLHCKKLLWDNEPVRRPENGNYVVCIFCGYPMQFNKKLNLVKVKSHDLLPDNVKEASKLVKLCNAVGYPIAKRIEDLANEERKKQRINAHSEPLQTWQRH